MGGSAFDSDEELMGVWGAEEEVECMAFGMMNSVMDMDCNSRHRSIPRGRRAPEGKASAARVSRGSEVDRWGGLSVKQPKRDPQQHITATVVIYNTVAGGVPSPEDVKAAIDDMEQLYAACGWRGQLSEQGADFVKSELTVAQVQGIAEKVKTQPYVPPSGL